MMGKPNPMNCSTCEHSRAVINEGPCQVFCLAAVPNWVPSSTKRIVTNPHERCDAHEAMKGTFKRICLNCGHPIRTHHKYTNLGQDQWIHKFCEHPESPSKWHYETYGRDPQ